MSGVITGVIQALRFDFEPYHLTAVVVAGLGLAVPLILGWFAFRWIFGKAKGALFGGR